MSKLKTRIQQEDLTYKKIGEDIKEIKSKDSTFDGYKTFSQPVRKNWLPVGNYGLTQLDNIFSKAEYKTIKGDIHITIPVSHSVMKSFDFELHQYSSGDSDHENGISWNGKYSDKNTIKFNISYYDYRHSGVKSGVHLDKTVNCNNCEKVKSVGFAFSDNSRTKTIIIIRMVDALSLPRLVCKSLLLSYSTTEAVIKNLQDPNSYTVNFTKDESSYIDMSDIPNTKFLGYPYIPSLDEVMNKNNTTSTPINVSSQLYSSQLYPGGVKLSSAMYNASLIDTQLILGGSGNNGLDDPMLIINAGDNYVSGNELLAKAFKDWLGISQKKYSLDKLEAHPTINTESFFLVKEGENIKLHVEMRLDEKSWDTSDTPVTVLKLPEGLAPSDGILKTISVMGTSNNVTLLNVSSDHINSKLLIKSSMNHPTIEQTIYFDLSWIV